MKIKDNFLEQKEFDKLQDLMMGDKFAWYYKPTIDSQDDVDDENKFQFVHMFYTQFVPCSPFIEELQPIINLIQPTALSRIKANLLIKTTNIVENSFHVDLGEMLVEKQQYWTTSIFYINTNDGYTEFQDGRIAMENTIVKSVANRMVTFPANLRHRGTTCTDEKTRVVINFNYF